MDIPKPKPPVKKAVDQTIEPSKSSSKPNVVKPSFVRKPHLTDRPLRNNPGLIAFRDGLKNR